MDLLSTLSQHRVFYKICKYIGIRNAMVCCSKKYIKYPHDIFFPRLCEKELYDLYFIYKMRLVDKLPPIRPAPLRRQNARYIQPDAIYGPPQSAEYELSAIY